MNFTEMLQNLTGKPLADCTDQELYLALLEIVRQKSADRVQPVTGRKLYYISAEFLIGKLLSNNLINLGLYDEAREALAAAGKNLSDIEEVEPEPSLGNGGLGRDHPVRPVSVGPGTEGGSFSGTGHGTEKLYYLYKGDRTGGGGELRRDLCGGPSHASGHCQHRLWRRLSQEPFQ